MLVDTIKNIPREPFVSSFEPAVINCTWGSVPGTPEPALLLPRTAAALIKSIFVSGCAARRLGSLNTILCARVPRWPLPRLAYCLESRLFSYLPLGITIREDDYWYIHLLSHTSGSHRVFCSSIVGMLPRAQSLNDSEHIWFMYGKTERLVTLQTRKPQNKKNLYYQLLYRIKIVIHSKTFKSPVLRGNDENWGRHLFGLPNGFQW